MWHREIDYHGTREYAGDAPATGISRISLAVAWLVSEAKRQLESLLRSATPPSTETVLLLHEGERQFTVLGSLDDRRLPHRNTPCVFPEAGKQDESDAR